MTELYLISGFLGAGKTTLLQKLLREGFAGQKVALVENDFGAVSLDAKLLKSGGYTVQELRAGCICCTLNGNFVSALVSLLRRVQPDVVLIEPSGVAKLSDVEALCRDQRLAALAVLKQKITVVDAANCASYCENFGAFFEDQVRCADTLVFSHSDAGTPQSESARRLAQKLNPRAACFSGSWDTFSAQDILQQWCGINVIFNYAQEIFMAAGYGVSDVLMNIVVTGITNVIFTILAMFVVDRWGRKALTLIGSFGLAVIYAFMGAAYYFHITGVVLLIIVVMAIACYAMTLATVMWVIISEIFPNRIRGVAMSVCTFALWAACFILTYTFPMLNSGLGAAGTFWLYGLICLSGGIFVVFRLPETKGKSLEEIEKELVK